MYKKINVNKFLKFLRKSNKHTFKTLSRNQKFIIKLTEDGIVYTPKSSNKPRSHPKEYLERVINRYNKTGSLHPKDYLNLTVNSSYTLTLIKESLLSGCF